ncbi:MAG: hypothetical protein GYB64_02050, partial [Chloroflexi bacterium]|nr:hypothetical protein [Chloroflexota bacterium]
MNNAKRFTMLVGTLFIGILVASGCAGRGQAPSAEAGSDNVITGELPDGGSLSVTLVEGVGNGATSLTQPAIDEPDFNRISRPEHLCLELDGYALDVVVPVRWVCAIPVAEYESMNEAAAEQIDVLRNLLETRPALSDHVGNLPDLPVPNAAQVMQSQPVYLEFASGAGLRYLTMHVQDFVPVTNQGLAYSFQGLTEDGAYIISVTLPVSHPSLPASLETLPDEVRLEMSMLGPDDYLNTYGPEAQALIDGLDPSEFAPTLMTLDDLVKSI